MKEQETNLQVAYKPSSKWLIFILLLTLVMVCLYIFFARAWVEALYAGKASGELNGLIQWIYPRFFTEKHRFSLDFFLNKTDQIITRFVLLVGLLVVWWWSRKNTIFNRNLPTILPQHTHYLVYYFSLLALFFTWDWYFELAKLYEVKAFYQPVFLLKILQLPFPTPLVSLILCIILWVSAVYIAVGKQAKNIAAVLFFALFVLLQGYQMSFHKVDHHFALFTYWAFLMPYYLWEIEKKPQQSPQSFFYIQLCIALPYTIAGIEKFLIAGFAWFQADTLKAYLHLHAQPWGLWVAQSDVICILLSVVMMLLELGFVLVVFFTKAKWIFLPLGVLFHIGTFTLLNIGAIVHPWWLCYGVFLWSSKAVFDDKNCKD
jgi:uncharacterized membrane protein (DUF485 family)